MRTFYPSVEEDKPVPKIAVFPPVPGQLFMGGEAFIAI
jgi:hypothetical protein